MASARDNILGRIRAAQRGGRVADAAERDAAAAYLGAHPRSPPPAMDWDPLVRFRERAAALSSTVHEVATVADAPRAIAHYLNAMGLPAKGVCWPAFAALDWAGAGLAIESRIATGDDLVGITGAFCAIAETGTLVALSGPGSPPSSSLLPETHIAIVPKDRIVRAIEDAFDRMRTEHGGPPRAINFISGPSRTADVEQTLVLGAHGPYRVHVILTGS
jgi:L-lactate dehydrogenase complex protein LldG